MQGIYYQTWNKLRAQYIVVTINITIINNDINNPRVQN